MEEGERTEAERVRGAMRRMGEAVRRATEAMREIGELVSVEEQHRREQEVAGFVSEMDNLTPSRMWRELESYGPDERGRE